MTIKNNVKKLESIARAIRRASISQHFVPIFAVCNSLKEQEKYVEKLRRKCDQEGIVLTEVKLLERPPITRLLDVIKEHLGHTFKDGLPGRLGVQITGLELSILLDADEQAPAVLQILNMNRESYYKDFSFPFVFWLPEYACIKVANVSPDFWAIHVATSTFFSDETPGTPLPESIGSGKSLTLWQDKQSQIPVLERLLNTHPSPEVRVELLIKSADAYYYIGKTDKAQQRYEQAIKENQENNGNPQRAAEAFNKLGIIYSDIGEDKNSLEKAVKSLQQYLDIVEQEDKTDLVAMGHNHLGLVYDRHKKYPQALQAYKTAQDISRRHGHRKLEGDVLGNMGLLYRKQNKNKYKDALNMHQQALTISREMDDTQGEALDLSNIGLIYHEQNQQEKAIDYYNQALLINRHLGNKLEELNQLIHLGDAWKALGDFSKAFESYQSAKAIAEDININIFTVWDRLASLFDSGAFEDPEQEILLLKEAIGKSRQLEKTDNELQYWERLCKIHRKRKEIVEKNNCLMRMEALIKKQIQYPGDEDTIIRCYEKLEKIYGELGKTKKLESCKRKIEKLSYRQIIFWVDSDVVEMGDKDGQSILEVGEIYKLNLQVVRKPPKYSLIFKAKIPSFSDRGKISNIVEQPVIESRRISEEKKRSNIPLKKIGELAEISRGKNAASKVKIGDEIKEKSIQPTLPANKQEYYIPSGQQEKINKIQSPSSPPYMPETSAATILFHFKSPGISFERSKINVSLSGNNISDVGSVTITPKSIGDHKISVKVRVKKFEYENDFDFPLRVVRQLPFEISMVGRSILFEKALFDEGHPVHQRIMGEWRGMLAMLALMKTRQFTDLAVEPVRITKTDDISKSAFLASFSKLRPEKVLADDSSWDHLYIILFKNIPIGMTHPTTLVCTSTNYSSVIHGVQWFSGRFLLDPIRFLNWDEKKAVAYWLEVLKISIVNHPNINNNLREYALMISLLDEYYNDLVNYLDVVQEDFELSSNLLGMKHGIFQYLDRPVEGHPEVPVGFSHVRILPFREYVPYPDLLVVDKDIARQWGCGEQEILVYGLIPMARIPNEGLSGARDTIFETTLENARWCTPDEFFSEKLVLILQEDAFPGTLSIDGSDKLQYRNRLVTPIVPISDLILKYLNSVDIANRMRFEQIGEEIRVYLNLPLTGITGAKNGEDFVINKSYSFKKGDIIVQMAVPILEIWPDFIFPNWKIYYSYFSTTGEDKVIYATPFKQDDEKWDIRELKNKPGKIEREIIQMDCFPEAYECKTSWRDANKRLITIDAGILLLQKPEEIKPLEKTFNIGVDFGTSRTNVCIQEGLALPERIVFDDHFFRISAVHALQRLEMYDYFFPPLKEEMPILSIFYDFLIRSKDLRPMLDGHIYFPYDPKEFFAGDDRIKIFLKWEGYYERERVKAFLEQLCLMCSVEVACKGAGKVSWHLSNPNSFSDYDEQAYRYLCNLITQINSSQTGIKLDGNGNIYRNESIAFANYFFNHPDIRTSLRMGLVFINIDCEVSDISIWQGNRLLMKTSLHFAKRDIFSYPIWKKTEILDYFLKDSDLKALNRHEVKNNPTAFYAQLDAIMNAEIHNLLNRLPNINQEIKIKEFNQFLAIGIAGLLYYLGLLVRSIPDREKVIETAPNFYFGGNDARLLHWLAGGTFNQESAINLLLKGVFRKAAGITAHHYFNVKVSPAPGEEIAYGLVLHQTPLKYDVNMVNEGYFLAGETFVDSENNKHEWNERLTTGKIKAGIKLLSENDKFKMDGLQEFLETFNEYAEKSGITKITVNPGLLDEIAEYVNYECFVLRNTKEYEIQIEPLFITALKKLLDEKINEWAMND